MGRVVGDGAVVCYIQDLIVIPQVQAQGIGSQIIQKLKAYVESLREEGSTMMQSLSWVFSVWIFPSQST